MHEEYTLDASTVAVVAGGASAVIGTAVFIFDERIGNSVIRYFMDETHVSDRSIH